MDAHYCISVFVRHLCFTRAREYKRKKINKPMRFVPILLCLCAAGAHADTYTLPQALASGSFIERTKDILSVVAPTVQVTSLGRGGILCGTIKVMSSRHGRRPCMAPAARPLLLVLLPPRPTTSVGGAQRAAPPPAHHA